MNTKVRSFVGRAYRWTLARSPFRPTVRRKIGPFGPFKVDALFAFMGLERWGTGLNAGFVRCIESSAGATCVFDVGAHVGFVSLPLSRAVGSRGRVVAFEPAAANLHLLRRHLRLNNANNVHVVDRVVGEDTQGSVSFFEMDEPSGMNSLVVKKDPALYKKASKDVISLDRFARENVLLPDIVKIDVEGAELNVLRGATRLLATQKPTLFLSVHPTELTMLGERVEDLEHLLITSGYRFFTAENEPVPHLSKGEFIVRPKDDYEQG